MENELMTNPEPLSPEEARAKPAILAECENLAAAGVTFVAAHFDGYGDSAVTEEVQCFDSEYYAYDEHKPVAIDAAYLQEHFETLVPMGYRKRLRRSRRRGSGCRCTQDHGGAQRPL